MSVDETNQDSSGAVPAEGTGADTAANHAPTQSRPAVGATRRAAASRMYIRLALQNLLRRPTRTFMLVLAVTLCTGAVFASFTIARGIESSMEQSFARMGADLIVVPQDAMVNITSALLTVQPTESRLDNTLIDQITHLDGVAQTAAQTIFSVPVMEGMPDHKANLIAFDPATDFTVMPWLAERTPRPMKTGELLIGGRRTESIGDEVEPCGVPANIYGKLGRSGVGPLDESYFGTYATVSSIVSKKHKLTAPDTRPSAILVRLKFGATAEQVRFAVAHLPGVKVINGTRIVTSTRQTTTALVNGMKLLTALMLLGLFILIGLLFSAIIAERGREIGLLRAIGSRRFDVVGMLVAEAVFTTSLGGTFGILLGALMLLTFQHSLVYYLETMHVEFTWPPIQYIAITGLVCACIASTIGLIGAIWPAVKASGKEAYSLIQGEGA